MGLRLKTRVAKIINWLWADDTNGCISSRYVNQAQEAVCQSKSEGLSADGLTLKIFPGRGGIAIETYRYDRKIGEGTTVLHIVQEGDTLSESIAQIITLDSMRM